MSIPSRVLMSVVIVASGCVVQAPPPKAPGKSNPVLAQHKARMVDLASQLMGNLESDKGALRVRSLLALANMPGYLEPHLPVLLQRYRQLLEDSVARIVTVSDSDSGMVSKRAQVEIMDTSLDPFNLFERAGFMNLDFRVNYELMAIEKLLLRIGEKNATALARLAAHPDPRIQIRVIELIRKILD